MSFNALRYLASHPDLIAAFGLDTAAATVHYNTVGILEGRVESFDALRYLASRFPVVAISNGNADVGRVGIGEHFAASLSAHLFGVAKPDTRIFHAAAAAAGQWQAACPSQPGTGRQNNNDEKP